MADLIDVMGLLFHYGNEDFVYIVCELCMMKVDLSMTPSTFICHLRRYVDHATNMYVQKKSNGDWKKDLLYLDTLRLRRILFKFIFDVNKSSAETLHEVITLVLISSSWQTLLLTKQTRYIVH